MNHNNDRMALESHWAEPLNEKLLARFALDSSNNTRVF